MRPSLYSVLAFVAFGVSVLGGVQDEWVFPSLPDYSSSASDGDRYTFKWTSELQTYFKEFCPKCDPENVAVWLTGGGGSTYTKHQVSCKSVTRNDIQANTDMITASVDVVNSRSFVWTVDASGPAEIVYWVLRFTTPGGYVDGQPEVSSPMFKIERSSSESTSTSTESSPSPTRTFAVGSPILVSMTSSTASGATLTASSPSTPPDVLTNHTKTVVDNVKSKLTTPQIAGIAAAGAGVLLIVLVFLAVCCYRRRRRNKVPYPETQYTLQLAPVSNTQNPQLARPAAVHTPSTRSKLFKPHAATHMFSKSMRGSHAGNEDSRRIYDHPNGSHDTARADESDTSLISPPTRAPQDERSSREPTMDHADTGHWTSVRRLDDTSSGSNGAPAEGMSEIENPNAPREGRFSVNMKEYMKERGLH